MEAREAELLQRIRQVEAELEVVTQDKFALHDRLLSAEAALAAASATTHPASSSGLNEQALREQLERARDAKMAADHALVQARTLLSQVSLSPSLSPSLPSSRARALSRSFSLVLSFSRSFSLLLSHSCACSLSFPRPRARSLCWCSPFFPPLSLAGPISRWHSCALVLLAALCSSAAVWLS